MDSDLKDWVGYLASVGLLKPSHVFYSYSLWLKTTFFPFFCLLHIAKVNFSVIILNSGFQIPDSGFWFLDSGFRIPDSGFFSPI